MGIICSSPGEIEPFESKKQVEPKSGDSKSSRASNSSCCELNHIEHESSKEGDLCEDIKPYLNQDIQTLRRKRSIFHDNLFPSSINALVEPDSVEKSEFIKELCSKFGIAKLDLKEINEKVKWARCAVLCAKNVNNEALQVRNEFVLNDCGRALADDGKFSLSEYVDHFTMHDVFQGHLGDCMLIGTIMGLTRNKKLLAHLIPKDNAYRCHMNIGAYHFRFWRLGEWFDVVVDDYLPCDVNHNLIFARNVTYINELWIALFEKAVAKFVGRYDYLHGGLMSNISLLLSGGIHDSYCIELVSYLSKKKKIEIKSKTGQVLWKLYGAYFDKPELVLPDQAQLYDILAAAMQTNNLVGCFQFEESVAKEFGIYDKHQYLISDAFVKEGIQYLKVYNPHNMPDKIKSKPEYLKLEQHLIELNVSPAYPGEFFITYEDFLRCFEFVTVVNLLVDKPDQNLKDSQILSTKSSLFTEWKIVTFRSVLNLSTNQAFDKNLKMEITIHKKEAFLIVTYVKGSYHKPMPRLVLNLYSLGKNERKRPLIVLEHAGQHQCIFRTFLKPGSYVCHFEALPRDSDDKKSDSDFDLDYCARVFFDMNQKDSIQVKEYLGD